MKKLFTILALVFVSLMSSTSTHAQGETDSCLLDAYAINYSTTMAGVNYRVWPDSIILVDSGHFMTGEGAITVNTDEPISGSAWTYYNATDLDEGDVVAVGTFKPNPGVDSVHYTLTLTVDFGACVKVLEGYMLFNPDGSVDTARTNEAYRAAMRAAGAMPPEDPTSTKNIELEKNITVYPNPATNVVNVDVKNNKFIKMILIDLSGKTVTTTNNKSIEISNLATGMYFLRIETEKGILVKKVTKN